MFVTRQQIHEARSASLYDFLLAEHLGQVRRVGNSICLKSNKSLYIKTGYNGYRDFATDETGNAIDFLTRHMGYGFQEAVLALSGDCTEGKEPISGIAAEDGAHHKIIQLPDPAPRPHSRMYAYLLKRCIPRKFIDIISAEGIAYQAAENGNIVFVNKERDYFELRGTYTFTDNPFHGCRKASPDRFWYILAGKGKPETAFITEAAIDAISLMALHSRPVCHFEKTAYISIGGASNHAAINRIKRQIHTVLAVDNDKAGQTCREKHPELKSIIPIYKDWNEDLIAFSPQC